MILLLLLHPDILIRNIDAISAHDHLVVELVVHLVHLQLLPDGSAQHAASEAAHTKTRRHIESTIVAGGADPLMDALVRHLVLLGLALTA